MRHIYNTDRDVHHCEERHTSWRDMTIVRRAGCKLCSRYSELQDRLDSYSVLKMWRSQYDIGVVFPDPLVQAILIVKESLLDQADTATYCMQTS
jgi:hypothetical protein